MSKITISLIKADVGGYPGHSSVHPALIETAESKLEQAKKSGALVDFRMMACGDDLQLLMSHKNGYDRSEIHGLAWETFDEATEVAKKLKLYGAGQDLLSDAFSGNIRGMGPGIAEMEFTKRTSEPIVAFMMDKTEPGAFNLPIFRMFADPFNTVGLVIDPACHHGFIFEIWDIVEHKKVLMNCPEEMYDILALIGAKSRYVIKRVYPKPGGKLPEDEPVAVISTEKLFQIAGTYVGKDDPAGLVRSQSSLQALVAFMMDGTEPGTFSLPIYRMPSGPFNTAGWVINTASHQNFIFQVWDSMEHEKFSMNRPVEMYKISSILKNKNRYKVSRAYPKVEDLQYGDTRGYTEAAIIPHPDGKTQRKTSKKKKFDVLFCYNSDDRRAVLEIAHRLRMRGIVPWIDIYEIRPGTPWQRALRTEIPKAKAAAVFIGDGGTGPWQDLEIEALLKEFVNRGCPVIPVILPYSKETPELPSFLGNLHRADFRERDPDPLEHMIYGITGKKEGLQK